MTTTATTNNVHKLRINVPSHWKVVPLEDVLTDIVGGGTPSKANPSYWKGSIPWLSIKDMRTRRPADAIDHISEEAVQYSSTNIIPADTVIIATRVGLGKVVRVPYDSAINQDLKALIAGPELDKSYLEYWMTSIADYLESIGSGTTVKGIRLEQLRSIPFPLAPLNEQKLIVAEIEKQFSRLDEAVANLKRVKANLKRYKAAVLKAAVEGKLTEEWRKAHPEVEPANELLKRILAERRKKWEEAELVKITAKGTKPKDDKWKRNYGEPTVPLSDKLPSLPEGWVFAGIEQLLQPQRDAMKTGPFGSLLKKHEHKTEGVPVLGIENIEAMRFVLGSKIHITKQKAKDLAGYTALPGDVLISRSGTVGEVCVVPENIGEARMSTNLLKLTLAAKGMLPDFFTFLFNGSPFVLNQVSELCKGSTRIFLNQDILKRLVFVLPPFQEQIMIVQEVTQRFSLIDGIAKEIERNVMRAERLRQSVLHTAFNGKLGIY